MKTNTLFIVMIASVVILTSCEKQNEIVEDTDYLIFGHFYGECIGENCVEIFKLESDRILEDENDTYPNQKTFYTGNYNELDMLKFEQAKDLLDFFPQELLDESSVVIGQPDAGDWGGIYVEYNFNGVRKFWLIDQMKSNIPAYLHEFVDKTNEKIELINKK